MSKILAVLVIVSLIGLGFAAGPEASMAKEKFTTFEVVDFTGMLVKNPAGEVLGSISDFVIDPGGHAIFAILRQGALEDIHAGRYVAVPFSALSIKGRNPDQMIAVLDISRRRFDSLPNFGNTKDLDNAEWATSIYRQFGLAPYWTEKEAGKPGPATNSPEGGYDYPY